MLSDKLEEELMVFAYEGTIMNSWKARRPPAWEPPFRTFWTGKVS